MYHHNTKLVFLAFISLELVEHFYLSVWTGFPAHAGVTGLPCSPPSSLCKRKFHTNLAQMIPVLLSVSVHSFSASIYGWSSQTVLMQLCCLILHCVLGGCRVNDGGLGASGSTGPWKTVVVLQAAGQAWIFKYVGSRRKNYSKMSWTGCLLVVVKPAL